MNRAALVHAPGDGGALAAELAALGWDLRERDLDLLMLAPPPLPPGGADWSAAAAMGAVADVIADLTGMRERLRPNGLAIVAVPDPAERAAVDRAAGGVVSAALAMAVQVLAADSAQRVRCLLVVTAGAGPGRLAAVANWLAAPDAPALTGQTLDLGAAGHAVLRLPVG